MKRAILSVYDKTGLVGFAHGLVELGFELVASGGTARALSAAGLPVTQVDQITGFPEILGGRVKTLHPAVHGGILARRTPEHLAELAGHGIAPVGLVACNLYPFAATVAKPGVTEPEAIEEIDIGGVTLLRAAAKNFESVTVVCDPADYAEVLREAEAKDKVEVKAKAEPLDLSLDLNLDLNRRLALKAFRHTAAYDAAIATWLSGTVEKDQPLPTSLNLAAERVQLLRYGENPHQQAALYRWAGAAPPFEQLQGKELSYNNIVDLEAAWAMPHEFAEPTVAIIKHTNPSGLASAANLLDAYRLAFACDPVSAFGSIIAANREVDRALVEEIGSLFVEVLAAPAYAPDALAWLAEHKKNCRVMVARKGDPSGGTRIGTDDTDLMMTAQWGSAPAAPALLLRSVAGGLLAQTSDERGVDEAAWQVVTHRQPTEAERRSLAFAWLAAKHVKSNAIVFVQGTATVGVGAGQMNRVDSVYLAARRAGDRSIGAVMGSDAFFPFADGIEAAAAAGVTACIQPGGSLRDEEAITAADRLGLAMVFTGERHFRH
jgi:phosphoribosylaminoimidazolecarboxamide formyltransferase/IMP cyclohydrolase